ncbi:DUF177 domain-containing protein [Phaeovibrio sulfidiphilus]|uniref:DUF177 domain-containing protein n=1 Tax=Phaeovibrio sulfidiphilus TaxID=1220600 RepID=A0A8J6YKP3_9PROT|nr:DUF177 domain-containing protein [Phaeovibrio sulfidiphilus]MBE1236193.1 DUF177 domain-containing protein [Phaeovibrio sulfidiphilus]
MSGECSFSHPLEVLTLPASGRRVTIRATGQECADLARFLGLETLESLEARLLLEPVGARGRRVRVSGQLAAVYTQLCSLTGAPVHTTLDESFFRVFLDGASDAPVRRERPGEIEFDAFDDDEPDPMENGTIDAGLLLTEELSLRIDPYPRAPDAEFHWSDE